MMKPYLNPSETRSKYMRSKGQMARKKLMYYNKCKGIENRLGNLLSMNQDATHVAVYT